MERLTNNGTKEAKPDVTISEALKKLAEYENFEEIFRSKMAPATCDFLKDKEEFAKWLDRNKWIAKKCDEYARAEEQGKLLKLPCAVGDTVYVLRLDNAAYMMNNEKVWEIVEERFEIRHFDCIGKTVFLTRKEAEQALKETEGESADIIGRKYGCKMESCMMELSLKF